MAITLELHADTFLGSHQSALKWDPKAIIDPLLAFLIVFFRDPRWINHVTCELPKNLEFNYCAPVRKHIMSQDVRRVRRSACGQPPR